MLPGVPQEGPGAAQEAPRQRQERPRATQEPRQRGETREQKGIPFSGAPMGTRRVAETSAKLEFAKGRALAAIFRGVRTSAKFQFAQGRALSAFSAGSKRQRKLRLLLAEHYRQIFGVVTWDVGRGTWEALGDRRRRPPTAEKCDSYNHRYIYTHVSAIDSVLSRGTWEVGRGKL